MAKKIDKKVGIYLALEEMRARVSELEELGTWTSWDMATEIGHAKDLKRLRRLDQARKTVEQIVRFIEKKRTRKDGRKAETGSRLLKCCCQSCGYIVRASFMCIARAIPECPDPNCEGYREPMDHEEPESYNPNMMRDSTGNYIKNALDMESLDETPKENEPHPDGLDDFFAKCEKETL